MRSQINDLYEFYSDAFRLEHTYHYTWYGCAVTAVMVLVPLLVLLFMLLFMLLLLPLLIYIQSSSNSILAYGSFYGVDYVLTRKEL